MIYNRWINLKQKIKPKYYNFLLEKDVERFFNDLGLDEKQKEKIRKYREKILKKRNICFLGIIPKTFYTALIVYFYPEYKKKILETIRISDASIRKGIKVIDEIIKKVK